MRQFNLEAQIVARLEHPHIVPLYDYWREPNNAFLVMRYLRGGSLLNVLKNQPSIKEAARLFDQIARALAVAHQASVIHQDIKPGNILLDENDNAYLSDFGIARDLSVSPEEHQIRRGTLAYMAPEQFMSSEKEITHHVDIYSMGVILYELIAGERAFKPASETDLIRAKVHGKVPSVSSARPDLPPGIDEIIQKATHKVPSERHNTIIELSDAFQEYVAGSSALQTPNRPISASRPPRSEAVLDESTPQQIIEPVNPFLGLRAFQEGDARFFFGREQVTKQLIYRLAQYEPDYRFLAVVGPSGSGKSSVVKAGVIPALRAGAVPGSR
ncbi:MAG: protein kinase, partial [Anaerolineae bacterium]|nr:protein kinase [Anaerolineae bacterium]